MKKENGVLDRTYSQSAMELIRLLKVGETTKLSGTAYQIQLLRVKVARELEGKYAYKNISKGLWEVTRKDPSIMSLRAVVYELLDQDILEGTIESDEEVSIPSYVSQYNRQRGTVFQCKWLGNGYFIWQEEVKAVLRTLQLALEAEPISPVAVDAALNDVIAYCKRKKARKA